MADDPGAASYDFEVRTLTPVETLRHSASHLMASAVAELFPGAKFGVGPHIDHGFYYDMELSRPVTADDLPVIEAKMREIAKGNHRFQHSTMSREEALAWAEGEEQTYKMELLDAIEDDAISFYTHGGFTDMCAGPHVNYTKKLKHFKLTHTAGAYWRGDEKRPMLTRIYGVAFETKEELEQHLHMLEEAKKRDHRRIGKDLELFRISKEFGTGLVLWLPNGARIRKEIEDFWREQHLQRGYDLLFTPHVAPSTLWDRSGHNEHYADGMYGRIAVEEEAYQLKPMNCPFHVGVFGSKVRSYRDLPMRFAELGTVYRYERSGTLHGLMRVRGFTQDDAHIFCTPDTLEQELGACLDLAQLMYKAFGFPEYRTELSVRDANDRSKYLGDDAIWDLAESKLASALDARGIPYVREEGEAVFYGPKIDVKVVDAIGRAWQLTTIQLDFNLPQRFDLSYVGADNAAHQPIMIHRALLGSIERFFGILVEHYAGNFPVWLAPTQVKVLPLSDKFLDYADDVAAACRARGLRVKVDKSDERLGYKVRAAENDKVPYAVVVGGREQDARTVGIRKRLEGDIGTMPLDGFIDRVVAENESRALS